MWGALVCPLMDKRSPCARDGIGPHMAYMYEPVCLLLSFPLSFSDLVDGVL